MESNPARHCERLVLRGEVPLRGAAAGGPILLEGRIRAWYRGDMSRQMEDMRRMQEDPEVVRRLEKRLGVKLGPPMRDLSHIPLLKNPGTPLSKLIIEERSED